MTMVAIMATLGATSTEAKSTVLWEDQGFKVEYTSWITSRFVQDWIGLAVALTIPEGGTVTLRQDQNFRLWLPCKNKFVYTKGIAVGDGCGPPTPQSGWDTRDYSWLTLAPTMGCEEKGGRILLLVRLPHMFPTKECLPTKLEWVEGEYHAAQ